MRLRSRLTGTLVLSVGLALLLSAVADLFLLRVVLRHDFAQSLRQESVSVTRYWRRHQSLPYRIPLADSVAVYTPSSALTLWVGSQTPPSTPHAPGLKWIGSTLTVTRFLPNHDGIVMVYANGFSLVSGPLWRLAEVVFAVTLACILLAWLVAVRLARDLTRPLTDLTEVAGTMSASADLESRVSESSNVVEVRSLAQAFNRMIDRLGSMFVELRRSEQRERALRESTAHDLYTPLSTVLAALELLEGDTLNGEERSQALGMARLEANRLRARVDQALGRSGEGHADVADIAQRVAAGRSKVHPPKSQTSLIVPADPEEVREVLDLVVDNALRHNPEGTEVWIECTQDGDRARVEIRDDGRGIAPDRLPEVLKRDVHGGPAAGLGLGLPLARDLVRSRGGTLTLSSLEGEGTVVTLEWPVS